MCNVVIGEHEGEHMQDRRVNVEEGETFIPYARVGLCSHCVSKQYEQYVVCAIVGVTKYLRCSGEHRTNGGGGRDSHYVNVNTGICLNSSTQCVKVAVFHCTVRPRPLALT